MVIGAQLYTVREFTKNLHDFEETLKKVTDMGCKVVQATRDSLVVSFKLAVLFLFFYLVRILHLYPLAFRSSTADTTSSYLLS